MYKRDTLPSLDLLKTFEAAARHLSFTLAGVDLHLSQSAVSRQIQSLEEQLGVRLFQRRTRSLILTEKGQTYYRAISQLLDELRKATAKLLDSQFSGTLVVSTAVTFASLWLVTRLSSLQQKHPEIRVHVAADNRIRDLKREQIDVAIRYSTRKMAGPGAQKLFGESVVPVCSPNLLSGHSLTSPDDLHNFALLHFEDPDGRAPWLSWNVWFEVMKLRPTVSKGALQFSHYDQVIRAAVNGQGVALGRMPLIKTLIQSGQLTIPLKLKRYSIAAEDRAYWLILSPSSAGRPDVDAFVEWLKQEVTQSAVQPA